jgi:CIC family chloride channel protein
MADIPYPLRLIAHAPSRLRSLVRSDELGLLLVSIVIGAIAGLSVAAMNWVTQALHATLFDLTPSERLSGLASIDPLRALVVLTAGGLLLAGVTAALARWRSRHIVDPIEANALHGGKMSLSDSLILGLQNIISNGFGASVGLEAGYTQLCSSVASRVGLWLNVRRSDLRMLVGCGAAAAIAAAFNAPLAGTFYAFELIIGTYSIVALVPVAACALVATVLTRALVGNAYTLDVGATQAFGPDYAHAIMLGALCATIGIALMYGVTLVEQFWRLLRIPVTARPIFGGIVTGGLALITPQVLSAGHGALHTDLVTNYPLDHVALIFALKALAAIICIGSAFRGGLFFASLFLGALVGLLYSDATVHSALLHPISTELAAIIGMAALAAAVVGGPMTMTMLVLELTGDFSVTVSALVAVCISSLIVRKVFGFSFATWRFHMRGESIRSAHDVGWIRQLTVGRLMRQDLTTVPAAMPISEFQKRFPLGSKHRVIALDDASRYVGIVNVADAFTAADIAQPVASLAEHAAGMLSPQMNAREAILAFDQTEADALVVVENLTSRRPIGILTEAHVLRRYSEELEERRREVSGEI